MITTASKTKLFGVIGTPIGHTISPKMHDYLSKSIGIDAVYLAHNVAKKDLEKVLFEFKASDISGFNITIPYKTEIIKYLDGIEETAKNMNAVNVVVNRNGKWYGYNTDGEGFCSYLQLKGYEIKDKDILIIGAGGAALGVCYKLAEFGANSLSITARTYEKVHNICEMVKKYSKTKTYDFVDKNKKYDIIINATPLGMHPYEDKNPCEFMELVSKDTTCCDLVYNPKKTLFLQEAENRGAKILNGLGMLILQGILAFELFNNIELDHKKYYEELSDLFNEFKI